MKRLVLTAALAAIALPATADAASRADLTVGSVKLTGAQVQGKVRNGGRATAKKTTVELVVSSDARRDARDTRLATVSIKALKARKTGSFRATVKTPATLAAGRYTVLACADPAKKVRESKETNNCRAASAKLTVTAPAPALPVSPAPFPQPVVAPPAPTPTATPTPTPTPATGAPAITSGPSGTVDSDSATFTFTGADPFECRLDDGAWATCTSPKTYANLPGGDHSFEVRSALGSARRDWTAAFEAPAPGPTDPPATDPAPSAPAPVVGEAALMGDSTEFLYTGANAIQTGVAPNTIKDQRAAVIRGRVVNRMGTGIGGVRVTVLDHPEYGRTATRDDGHFDLAVNGGAPLTLSFARAGYVGSQRTVDAGAQDFEGLQDVTLIPYSDTVTGVDLDSASQPEVVRGAAVTDDAGTRRPTLLFDPGTEATAKLADGTTVDLPSELNVRATEFTVGETGPSAMPGELPPTSAYTYAVEYSVDEADELGAVDVRFDKPVATYTDNFLEFPAGTAVPTGYYDRAQGRWIPSRDGRVVEIVGETGGLADVDLDGDGDADPGIDDAERRRLAQIYDTGKSLWRVEITHFTPWDHNWPYGPEDGAEGPDMAGPGDGDGDGGCDSGGSIIGCERQTLGEEAGIAGTPYRLRYASDRVPGRRAEMTLDIPLTDDTPPGPLRRIEVVIEIAGQTIQKSFAPGRNLNYVFTWDGKDAYGRTVMGRRTAHVHLGYTYRLVYREPADMDASFAAFGATPITATSRAAREFTAWQDWKRMVGGLPAPPSAIGGWNLDVHQTYDPVGRTLYGGDGTKRSAEGQNFDSIRSEIGPPRSGARRIMELDGPESAVRTPDGTLLIADTGANVIRKVDPAGAVSVLAAGQLNDPSDLALGPDGSIYVAERGNSRVRRIAPGGQITTVAGTGEVGYSGDGGPATQARFSEPSDVAVSPDGTLWVLDGAEHVLRRIGTDGVVSTALGDGTPTELNAPRDVALREDGSVLIADTGNHRVLQLDSDGSVRTVAGTGDAGFSGDGGPATEARLNRPSAVVEREDGSILIADASNFVVRSVSSSGVIVPAAGIARNPGESGDNGPALRARLAFPQALLPGSGSEFEVLDTGSGRLRAVELPMPVLGIGESVIPSADAAQLFVFNRNGRHVRTLDAMTGATLLTFGYDGAGRLTSVTDDKNHRTTIERDAAGAPAAIVAPFGQRTDLDTDANGYLSKIEDPTGSRIRMTYDGDGLMTGLTDPRDGSHTYTYDSGGRLETDRNGEGALQRLTRTVAGDVSTVTLRTAEGRETRYRNETLSSGEHKRTITDPSGAQTVVLVSTDGVTTIDRPTGERETFTTGPDPRFGMTAPLITTRSIRLPSGKTRIETASRTVDLADEGDPLSVTRLVEHSNIDGRASSVTYEAATKRLIARSPSGAESVTTIDGARRPLQFSTPGITPVSYVYDVHGRIERREQGPRVWRYTYDAQGLNATVTDPIGRVTSYGYDAAGHLVSRTLPGGRTIAMTLDAGGLVSSLTPPGKAAHGLTYTKQGQLASYTAPGAAAMTLTYDDDDTPTAIDRPGAADVAMAYDAGGRLQTLTEAGRSDTVTYDYQGVTSRIKRVTAPDQSVEKTYDGALPLVDTYDGVTTGALTRTYDDSFRIASTRVGTSTVERLYDADGLPESIGELQISRGTGGLPTGTQLRGISTTQVNDAFGAPESITYAGPSGFGWVESAVRNDGGAITSETSGAYTTTYGRDEIGRITSATRGGAEVTYTYDDNGNRLTRAAGAATTSGVYDEQDRLRAWGTTTFEYQASGELARKVAANGTTAYDYDARGNLRKAVLPGGTELTYTVDGFNRRTAVRKGTSVTARYVYGEATGPSAEVSPTGTVVTRFVYGARPNVPEYMVRANTVYRFVLDSRGSVRAVVNTQTGAVAQRIDYDEFGRVLDDTNPGFQPFGFAGGLYDRDTGLVHFDARDYDPEVGRFTAKDPIGFDGGDTNLYAYAFNDPVSFVDPSGNFIPIAIAAAVVGGGLINGAIQAAGAAASGCATTGDLLSAFGQGFVSGSLGTLAGIAVTTGTGNPIAGGIAAGLVTETISQGFAGEADPVGLIVAGATGPIGVGGRVLPIHGPTPNVWSPRGPGRHARWRQESFQIVGQHAIDTAAGAGMEWFWNEAINGYMNG